MLKLGQNTNALTLYQLNRSVKKARVVSFDIYDTAILRVVERPTDVFGIVEKEFTLKHKDLNIDFPQARIDAEISARKYFCEGLGQDDVNLDQIYIKLINDFGVFEIDAEKLKQLEITAEIALTRPNPYIYNIYQDCLKRNKPVIFTSDMYLPYQTIKTILSNNGYGEHEALFLSSSDKYAKGAGTLFNYVFDKLGIKPNELLHFGDNFHSDVKMAEKSGAKAVFYPKCLDLAIEDNWQGLQKKDLAGKTVYNALANANKYAKRPLKENDANFWYSLGFQTIGAYYLGFAFWLADKLKNDGINKVFFLARDGHILKKAYDIVKKYHPDLPDSHYLYASRRALNFPSIYQLKPKDVDFLVSGTSLKRVGEYLERIGLNAEDYNQEIKSTGFSDYNQEIVTDEDRSNLRKLIYRLEKVVLKQAKKERKLVLEYLENIDFFANSRQAVVDIGWHGTLQKSLLKIIEHEGRATKLSGYYIGLIPIAKKYSRADQQMNAFLFEFGQPEDTTRTIMQAVPIVEFIHAAPHGSVLGFSKENDAITPVFDEIMFANQLEFSKEMQKGALDFVNKFMEIHRSYEFVTLTGNVSEKAISRLLDNPTLEEAINLGNLQHADSFGKETIFQSIADPGPTIKNPLRILKEFKRSYWRAGYKKRLFSLRK